MRLCTVEWKNDMRRSVGSAAELLDLLDEIARHGSDLPVIANVEHCRTGDIMALGIGGPSSFLSFTPASLDPPYFVSVSESTSSCDNEVEVFFYCGAWTEIPKRHLISNELARAALIEFVSSGCLSSQVSWEET
jgi:hypothetical protein